MAAIVSVWVNRQIAGWVWSVIDIAVGTDLCAERVLCLISGNSGHKTLRHLKWLWDTAVTALDYLWKGWAKTLIFIEQSWRTIATVTLFLVNACERAPTECRTRAQWKPNESRFGDISTIIYPLLKAFCLSLVLSMDISYIDIRITRSMRSIVSLFDK